MLFNSAHFAIFFPIVIALYFIIPHRFRWVLLLGASYYFYMASKPEYILLIILSTCIDYYASIRMGRETEKKKRKKYLYLSLFSNLGLLMVFKYFNFFNDTLKHIFTSFNLSYGVPKFSLLVPMGISFYTFQTLSYTIDVYRGVRKPEKHFGIFALYVSFFPQLVAGPIERSEKLLPQFYEKHRFDYKRVTDGLKRMMWGFFKKLVIADRASILVKAVYDDPTKFKGLPLVIATVVFAFQIYCDFSAYSDIAIGSAKIMGFDLMENFRSPYFSKSIKEFWSRWHISLSSWFKDYLYIPLGGNRVSVPRYYFNMFIIFLVSGLWHGANWTYVVWGALHGTYMVLGEILKPIKKKAVKFLKLEKVPILHNFIRMCITFGLVCFAWIFFVAENLGDAVYVVKNIGYGASQWINVAYVKSTLSSLGLDKVGITVLVMSIIFMEIVQGISLKKNVIDMFSRRPIWIRWAFYYVMIVVIFLFGVFTETKFLYFQF